jgi:hypothetical protein
MNKASEDSDPAYAPMGARAPRAPTGSPAASRGAATFLRNFSAQDPSPKACRYSGITVPSLAMIMNQCCHGMASSVKMPTMSV